MPPKKKSDARGGTPKPGTKQAKDRTAAERVKKAQQPADEQKKPTVKQVIGGASWTGKLPVNLMSEHCQKHKWEKPEYTMDKIGVGFVSSVILRRVDPKTRETASLPPMRLPVSFKQPTALEARHYAATYALFHVCNKTNLHMMLPPTYKKLWKEDFEKLKAADVKRGDGWLYEADPFLAKKERDSAAADVEKKQKEREITQATSTDGTVSLGPGPSSQIKQKSVWASAPKVDLGNKVRREIEALVQEHAIWNPYDVKIPEAEREALVEEFTGLGFRKSHVEEASAACKDREEVLEWLLIYVPEDDLPPWCLPEKYSVGVTIASDNLARESKIKRLASTGYPADLCARTLDSNQGDELATAEFLQCTLVHGNAPSSAIFSGGEDAWADEQETLEAIFGERYSATLPKVCEIRCEPSDNEGLLCFRFQRPSGHYPSSVPIISIQAKSVPAYIRLSAIRQAVRFAEENFLGEQMIYNIIDWLETHLPEIIRDPGRLRDISTISAPPVTSPETTSYLPIRQRHKSTREVDWSPGSSKSLVIKEVWEARQSTRPQQMMLQKRESLPAWNTQDAIIRAVNAHQVTIISGETGSGKSTQSVQFVLDDMIKKGLGAVANIICTQPRRISALGLADRVSDERCSTVGDEVGYVIRGESKVKAGTTKITFVTTGVLLRRIQAWSGSGNIAGSLADVTHVVVDEVHERSLDTDFLLALLRDILRHRKDIKVILMSATLDADIFTQYFGGRQSVGLVHIPGRTFPVDDYYLDDVFRDTGFSLELTERGFDEDIAPSPVTEESFGKILRSIGMGINYELIAATVRYIDSRLQDEPGGILIFLPGTMEIERCLNAVRKIPNAHPLPLHASLLPAEQRRVFLSPPKGKRKIIAATNVAETSITIEDIVAVIDTGRVKETSYDPKDNMVRLQEVWASQAACKQRRGRAGRVRAGTCYKLYTRNAEASMPQRPDPEIRRVPLEQLCLSVRAMKGIDDVASFLANTITPPESIAVEGALDFLHRVGALDHDKLTALGRYLSMIPADLRCAKLMVYGSIFSCIDACITIAAILTVKSPFVSPREKREEADTARASFSTKGDGDLLTDLSAYQQWSNRVQAQGYWSTQSWCTANFLSLQTLRDISSNRAQFIASLKDAAILPVDFSDSDISSSSYTRFNRNANNRSLLRALVAGAFQPQIARIAFPDKKFASSITGTVEIDPDARTIKYFNQENGRVFIHPSSLLFSAQSYSNASAYLSYFTKMETSKVFIRDLTPFNAYSLLLFCGSIDLDTTGRGLVVDGWLRLRGWARIGVLVSRLRMMVDEIIASSIDNPTSFFGSFSSSFSSSTGNCAEKKGTIADQVIDIVKKLIEFNGLDR